ncbi:MAG TPA: hypothetical protein DD640_02025 [Clostridiales bacterium]|nr:hypothetical protein [Clostridiales bacterium]
MSTIHAFCLSVIRDFYHQARDESGEPLVSPDFMIDDGAESDILLDESVESLLQECHEAIDLAQRDPSQLELPDELTGRLSEEWTGSAFIDAFYRLVDGYGGARNENSLKELILSLYRFLRSMPDYAAFVREKLAVYDQDASCFSQSEAAKVLVGQLKLRLDRAMTVLDDLESGLESVRLYADRKKNEESKDRYRDAFSILSSLHEGITENRYDYDEIYRLTRPLAEIAGPRGHRSDTPEKKAFSELFCSYVAEAVYTAAGGAGQQKCLDAFRFNPLIAFERPSDVIEAELMAMRPSVHCLMALVLAVDARYATQKHQAGIIDFSDFEHLALTILRSPEAGEYYRSRIKEVYIDEYQDTSSIQEAIVASITDRNCLMVGDVKQSIYRFRHAQPRLFLDRAAGYLDGRQGKLFLLNRNFRSVAGILAAANDLFSQLMSRGAGEIEYDESQMLCESRPDDPGQPAPVTLLLLDRQPGDEAQEEEDDIGLAEENEDAPGPPEADVPAASVPELPAGELSREQQEAWLAVRQMHLLHKKDRAWKDMAVLCRTRAVVKVYRDQLEAYGIPIAAETDGNILDTPVLRLMEALINLLDNVRQDIPLAAVLKSDLYRGGFSAEELALIRLDARRIKPSCRFYHDAVFLYAQEGSDLGLRRRLGDFLDWLERLRGKEQILSISELVGLIFAETGWLDRLAAQPGGAVQICWLRQFQAWAEKFESRRQRGLYAFARYLESLRRRNEADLQLPAADTDCEAVRVMTIHGSKGLEFPIVFLVGTGYGLRPRDSRDSVLISETLGIGPDFADTELQVRYPTHLKLAMLEANKATSLAEEMRLLYVAMTRAMDQLHVVGSVRIRPGQGDRRLALLLEQARGQIGRRLPDYLVLSGRSYLEWIILALARQTDLDLSWLTGSAAAEQKARTEPDFQPLWRISRFQIRELQKEIEVLSSNSSAGVQPQGSIQPAGPDPAAVLFQCLSGESGESGQDSRLALIRQSVAEPYRFADAARTPAKLTVSELKRREQTDRVQQEEDGVSQPALLTTEMTSDSLPRGIGLTLRGWPEAQAGQSESASRLGTVLHALFRYLDLPAARQQPDLPEIDRQLAAMASAGMLAVSDLETVRPFRQNILAFIRSDLAGAMAAAFRDPRRPIYQEMPFTLAVPAGEIYTRRPGLAPDDRVMVQGIIDCWFEDETGITLIDYKSDRLDGDAGDCLAELRRRYSLQMAYYARAIRAATGKKVNRRLIWLIRQARAYEWPAEGDLP